MNRVQLRRAKGWRMPENTVKVDRSTPWGNPFVVGKDGNRAECVYLFAMMLTGYTVVSKRPSLIDAQIEYRRYAQEHTDELRDHDLACWCPIGTVCHADVLIAFVNGGQFEAEDPYGRRSTYGMVWTRS